MARTRMEVSVGSFAVRVKGLRNRGEQAIGRTSRGRAAYTPIDAMDVLVFAAYAGPPKIRERRHPPGQNRES